MTTSGAMFIGILIPFAVVFAVAGMFWLKRQLARLFLYARPKYLERRINLAAEFVDARRAYRLGSERLWVSVSVGRQYRHHEQARAVLLDEFLPRDAEPVP